MHICIQYNIQNNFIQKPLLISLKKGLLPKYFFGFFTAGKIFLRIPICIKLLSNLKILLKLRLNCTLIQTLQLSKQQLYKCNKIGLPYNT